MYGLKLITVWQCLDGTIEFLNIEVRFLTIDIVGFECRCSHLTNITQRNFDPRALLHVEQVRVYLLIQLGASVPLRLRLRPARDPVRLCVCSEGTTFIAARRFYV